MTFCTAISLSTLISTIAASSRASIAFFALTTGIGQLSPIAFTFTMFIFYPPIYNVIIYAYTDYYFI